MQGSLRCQTLPKDFGITEMYRVVRHLYDPYLPSYSYGNYWPVLQWKIEMDIFALRRSQRKIFPRKEPNECSIDL